MSTRLVKAGVVALVVVGVVLAAWLATATPDEDLPLSPRSTGASGTQALTEILAALDAEVAIGDAPGQDAQAALLLVDNLEPDARDAWLDVARRGGVLVVADPSSTLAPEPAGQTGFGFLNPPIRDDCALEALSEVERVQPGGGTAFAVPEDGVGCYDQGAGPWLVATPEGQGTVVATGGAQFLTNRAIREADNALLAVSLLLEGPGSVVAVAAPDFTAEQAQGQGLADLVPDAARVLALQLLAAFVVVILWRSRRLGAPVVETSAAAVPGSELVLAVGGLYEQGQASAHAAALLRQDVRRSLRAALGLGAAAGADELVEAAVDAGADRGLAERVLLGHGEVDVTGLVELAQDVERLRAVAQLPADANRHTQGASRV